ncbi:hypothetical protein EV363DRAFT_113320 [Boletus edulis]|nr:hypothetical protein EV363DRAFT_113320 [Boletus edulis]
MAGALKIAAGRLLCASEWTHYYPHQQPNGDLANEQQDRSCHSFNYLRSSLSSPLFSPHFPNSPRSTQWPVSCARKLPCREKSPFTIQNPSISPLHQKDSLPMHPLSSPQSTSQPLSQIPTRTPPRRSPPPRPLPCLPSPHQHPKILSVMTGTRGQYIPIIQYRPSRIRLWLNYRVRSFDPTMGSRLTSVSHLASNASVDVPNICNTTTVLSLPRPVATVQSPRQVQTRPQVARPKTQVLDNQRLTQKQPSPPSSSPAHPSSSPAVVRGQMPPAPNFDFEESLSAANVTSVVNQVRSYPPPIRHHTSPALPSQNSKMAMQRPPSSNVHRHHTAPQKPGSSSSLSSSSHHTDATRRTDGSYGTSTSASSLSPAAEVRHALLYQID